MLEFVFNENEERRIEILGNKGNYGALGVEQFEKLDSSRLKTLIDEKFINSEDTCNLSPTMQQFYEFMLKHTEYKAHGYAFSPEREYYGIIIEGLEGKPKNIDSLIAFKSMFENADDFRFEIKNCYCWYD